MSRAPLTSRRRFTSAPASAVALAMLVTLVSCSPGPGPEGSPNPVSASSSGSASTAISGLPAISAQINQFRDNYAHQIIEIQLTNNTPEPVTVLDASLHSGLFSAAIIWNSDAGGIELPARQTKSLPAKLSEATCTRAADATGGPTNVPSDKLMLRITTQPAVAGQATLEPVDPHGVLTRNNMEQCVSKAAEDIAEFRPVPELDAAGKGGTAVVRIRILPKLPPQEGSRSTQGAGEPPREPRVLTIEKIDGTPLIAEEPSQPWPRDLEVREGGPASELRLVIRPARCDPHAVAEDKVGTLFPLRITVAGQQGVFKVDAGAGLRGRIHDFVISTCGPQQG
ncbi:hypothetical protein [Arthrobacter sp.]|uniref:hypothetical protein n=1 Tax=Arthrobacter sp. TaxID=1667 RepID=UPI002810A8CB|nr:hypothetical protein [Arthrobacter sp.]